jgi:hypothetical protein
VAGVEGYSVTMVRVTTLGACLVLLPVACGSGATGETTGATGNDLAAGTEATITFAANWTQVASQALVAGQPVRIAYDPARLASQCGGSATSPGTAGGFVWGIAGYYAIGDAAPSTFQVAITSAWATTPATITPSVAGTLQLWFGCSNSTGNGGWDSNYGQNYDFQVGQAVADAGSPATDAAATTGAVVVQVVGDAVSGNAGSAPPDSIVSTPIAGVLVYDGPWQAGNPLGQTNASGEYIANLPLGAHQIGVMMMTTDDSMFSSDGNAVTVTTIPGKLVIHVIPDTVEIETSYDAGLGNAIYVTGETSTLGNWQTATKASYNSSSNSWTLTENIPAGAQFKLILAPWVAGSSIPVSTSGVQWESGSNQTVPAGPYSVLNINPSF